MEEIMSMLLALKPDVDFTRETDLVGEGILTSFDIIQIVAMVRDEFGVKIPVADVVPDNFRSADTIRAMVQRLLDE